MTQMKKTNGQGHIHGHGRAGSQPRSHSKDTQEPMWERGVGKSDQGGIPLTPLASQIGSKHCSGRTLEGCLVTAGQQRSRSQAPGREREEKADGGTGGRDRWQVRQHGQVRKDQPPHTRLASSAMECSPGCAESQPAAPPAAPQQLSQDMTWAPNAGSRDVLPHGTPTTLTLCRREPCGSRWTPQVGSSAGQSAGSSGVRAGCLRGQPRPWASLGPVFQ